MVLFIYFLPYFILGEDSYIHIHDNLDSNVVWYHILTKFEPISIDGTIPQIMDGLPSSSLPGKFEVVYQLFNIMPTFNAYVVNEIIIRLIGLSGMLLLLKRLNSDNSSKFFDYSIAVFFSLLPIYPIYGATTLIAPYLIYAFINLLNNKKIILSSLIIAISGFYSSLFSVGMFICGYLVLFIIFDTIKNRKLNTSLALGFLILITSYIISNWQLIESILFTSSYQSHRLHINKTLDLDIITSIKNTIKVLLNGQYHASPLNSRVMLSIIAVPIFHLTISSFKAPTALKKNNVLLYFTGLLTLNSMFIFLSPFLKLLISFFSTDLANINYERFYSLNPTLIFVTLGLAIRYISKKISIPLAYSLLALAMGSLFITIKHAPQNYLSNFTKIFRPTLSHNQPTFYEFYAQDLFSKIKSSIGLPLNEYKVVSLGLHPGIAQYNGFYTLDSYQANYPLEYKHRFREIIAPELEKSDALKNYFDNWGSRCYIFSSELGKNYIFHKSINRRIDRLYVNSETLYQMGARYLISSIEILKPEASNMELWDSFEEPQSFWRLYLYKIIPFH